MDRILLSYSGSNHHLHSHLLAGTAQDVADPHYAPHSRSQDHKSLAADYALLLSIVSIGPKTAAVLLAEPGDLRRFANVRDLLAYVGLCPRLWSCGSSLPGPTPLTKRGNAVVRKALYFPALNALRFNPCLRPFSHRLLLQGKPKMVAVAAVMRKVLHLVYGVLCSGCPFDPAHVSVRPASSQDTLQE